MQVELLDSEMVNSDLGAVNAARVSFSKEKLVFDELDAKLLKYLWTEEHWSPLAHPHLHIRTIIDTTEMLMYAMNPIPGVLYASPSDADDIEDVVITGSVYGLIQYMWKIAQADTFDTICHFLWVHYPEIMKANGFKLIPSLPHYSRVVSNEEMMQDPLLRDYAIVSFRITAPIFVARQLVKHQVDLVWNEVSRRYVDYEPTFYEPDKWRQRAPNKKQGSLEEPYKYSEFLNDVLGIWNALSTGFYNFLLKLKIAPEMARMVLPINSETEWWWTGRLMAFDRVLRLRLHPHAQYETRRVAEKMREVCNALN